jgi:DinB superfamily
MNTQLAALSEQFRANAARAQSLASRVGESRLLVRPRPGAWSAAECLVHLTLSTQAFFPAWQAVFADAQANGLVEKGTRPFRMDFAGGLLNWFLQPSRRFRLSAPSALQPVASGQEPAGFIRSQDRLLEVLSESNGFALDRIQIVSPVNSRVRYNVWSSFRITDTHQRRHLLQAERAAGLSE